LWFPVSGLSKERMVWGRIQSRSEFIMGRDITKIMYIKTDDGVVDGVLKTDGYIDARKFTPHELAKFIQERVKLLS